VVDSKHHFRLTLPAGYRRVTSKAELDKLRRAAGKVLDDAAIEGFSRRLLQDRVQMVAVNPDTANGINMVVTPRAGLSSSNLHLIKSVLKEELKKMGVSRIAYRDMTVDGDRALRAEYVLPFAGRKLATIQYIAVHGDSSYTLTFTAATASGHSRPAEKAVVDSWHFE
jgi:hypothetical protein